MCPAGTWSSQLGAISPEVRGGVGWGGWDFLAKREGSLFATTISSVMTHIAWRRSDCCYWKTYPTGTTTQGPVAAILASFSTL